MAKSKRVQKSTGSKRTGSAASKSRSRKGPAKVVRIREANTPRYATCLESGCDLRKGKKYRVIPDPEREAEGLISVVDDSGEAYVYLARRFKED